MKKAILIIFILGLTAGCNSNSASSESGDYKPVEFHFWGNFINTPAELAVNGVKLYSDTLNTDHVLSLADILEMELSVGTHKAVFIFDGEQFIKEIEVENKLYIGVSYDGEKVTLRPSEEPYYYR